MFTRSILLFRTITLPHGSAKPIPHVLHPLAPYLYPMPCMLSQSYTRLSMLACSVTQVFSPVFRYGP